MNSNGSACRTNTGEREEMTRNSRSVHRRLRLLTGVCAAAVVSLAGLSTTSAADAGQELEGAQPHATGFSPYIEPASYTYGDCTIYVGPAYDDLHCGCRLLPG